VRPRPPCVPPPCPADPVGTRDPPRARHAMYSTADEVQFIGSPVSNELGTLVSRACRSIGASRRSCQQAHLTPPTAGRRTRRRASTRHVSFSAPAAQPRGTAPPLPHAAPRPRRTAVSLAVPLRGAATPGPTCPPRRALRPSRPPRRPKSRTPPRRGACWPPFTQHAPTMRLCTGSKYCPWADGTTIVLSVR